MDYGAPFLGHMILIIVHALSKKKEIFVMKISTTPATM